MAIIDQRSRVPISDPVRRSGPRSGQVGDGFGQGAVRQIVRQVGVVRRRPIAVEIRTATKRAAPLNTSLIQLATPANERPVTVKARKKMAMIVPGTLNRPGLMAV